MIPTPVLEAKDLADRVVKLETDMNRQYRRNKQVSDLKNLRDTTDQFQRLYNKVADLYPEYLHLIPNVNKPIFRR